MDYSSMKATKTGKRKIDTDIEISRSSSRKIKSAMRKSSIGWFVALIVLVFGFAGGYFANKFLFSKDTYAMIGKDTIFIGGEEETQTYTEPGVKCIAFGKDYSKDCTVTYYYRTDKSETQVEVESVDETKAGIYYAVYKSASKKYGSVTLIRNIIVLGEED